MYTNAYDLEMQSRNYIANAEAGNRQRKLVAEARRQRATEKAEGMPARSRAGIMTLLRRYIDRVFQPAEEAMIA